MALTAAPVFLAGAYHVQIAKRNSSGYPVGTVADPETIAADTTSSALYIGSLDSFVPPTPTNERAIDQGGQSIRGAVALGNSALGEGTVTLSEYNEALQGYIKSATVDVSSVDGFAMTPGNVGQVEFPSWVTLITGKGLNLTDGSEYYMTWVFHNVQWLVASAGGKSQTSGTNPNPTTYTLVPSKSTRNFTGVAFSATTGMAVVDGTDAWTQVRSRWPIALTSYIADGIAVVFTLGYRPVFSTVTGGNTDNSTTINGVATAATSIDTTTGVVTLAAAGTTADVNIAAYQTKFVAI